MRRFTALALGCLMALTACASGAGDVGPVAVQPADVDVDTPELRRVKDRIGMEDCPSVEDAPAVEEGLPDLTLPCLGGGRPVDLAALRGPLVVNIWQAFCAPCRKEMPALQEFHEQYGDQVAVLGIDYQDVRPAAALELAGETGATYPSLADPGGEINGRAGVPLLRGVPQFLLVDADGRVVHVEAGGVEEVAEVVAMVEEHLGVAL